jgi:hypothetical protein
VRQDHGRSSGHPRNPWGFFCFRHQRALAYVDEDVKAPEDLTKPNNNKQRPTVIPILLGFALHGGREAHLFIFGVDIQNPYTLNDVSAYTTDGGATDAPSRAKDITKKIRSATAFREVFRPESYFSVRQKLIYGSYGTRGREYKETPKFDRSKHQRSKDDEP